MGDKLSVEKAAVSLVSGAKAAGISVGADRGEQRIQCTSHSGWMGYFQAYLRQDWTTSDSIGVRDVVCECD